MINALYHTGTDTTIQFPAAPIRGNAMAGRRVQNIAFNSDGDPYVYAKAPGSKQNHPLIYTNVSEALLNALLEFYQSRNGDKHSFTWYDHDAASHPTRFDGDIKYIETSPGRFRVTITLFEDLP